MVAAFALAGASIGLGGAFLGAFNTGASTYLEGTITFDAIAAVLVGGTAITGGRGSILRTLGGALVIAAISDVLLLRGFATGAQILFKGVLVVAVVVITQVRLAGGTGESACHDQSAGGCAPSTCCRSRPSRVMLVAFLIVPGLDGEQLNRGSYFNTFQGFASLGLLTLAVGLPLIAGEFDVSVLGMQALGGVLAVRAGGHSGLLGVAAAVAACALLGLLQGTAIARLRLASLPVTIGTYIALLGLTNVIAANNTLTYGNIGASVWVDQPVSPGSLPAA